HMAHRSESRVFMSRISFHRIGPRLAVALCVAASVTACGARHVQLLFPPQNDSGEYWKCPPADPNEPPERRKNKCVLVSGGFGPQIGNTGRTTRVDTRECDIGEFRSITIMDAD